MAMASDNESAVGSPNTLTQNPVSDSPTAGEIEKMSDGGNDPLSLGDDPANIQDDDDEGLFGSGSEDGATHKHRALDDEALDSGDDEARWDRRGSPMEEDGAEYGDTLNIMDLNLARTAVPESTDGHIYTLAMPDFLTIESEDFNPETYVAPPFSSASTSLCWRYDPIDKESLQSNSRIIRWSDGSLTLQLASNPTEQYRISSKPLGRPNKPAKREESNTVVDAHAYLSAAAESSSVFRITSHITSALTILPTTVETDDAVQRLQESLAAATRTSNKKSDGTVAMFDVREDPELAKKQAEQAEREKLREARKRQAAVDRDLERGRRAVGYSRTGGAGLTIAGLEGEDEMVTTKARGKKSRGRHTRRGDVYSDEDEGYDRRGRTREDEYDEDDGFLVGSDEEPEMEEGEEEDEEELADDEDMDADGEVDDEVRPDKPAMRERQSTPKRSSEAIDDGNSPKVVETDTATRGSPQPRKKNRYVVDDDDDEDNE